MQLEVNKGGHLQSSSDVSSYTTGKRPTSSSTGGSGPSIIKKKKKDPKKDPSKKGSKKKDPKKINPKNKGVISPAAKIQTRDICIVKLIEANRTADTEDYSPMSEITKVLLHNQLPKRSTENRNLYINTFERIPLGHQPKSSLLR